MGETLLISPEIFYKIDSSFYKNQSVEFMSIKEMDDSYISNFKNIVVILDDMIFDCVAKTSYPFDARFHSNRTFFDNNTNLFFQNFDLFFNRFPKHTKFILYDNSPEAEAPVIKKLIFEWLEFYQNTYFISSRLTKYSHTKLIQNLIYLPLIYSFYQHNFYKYPKLDIPPIKESKYNFITYLGQSDKPDKIKYRFQILNKIIGIDNTIKYKDIEIVNNENLGPGREGHIWNILNSLTAKIQIIFETSSPYKWHDDEFLTEKTMKCFILSHPYIILLPEKPLNILEEYGFRFPIKCNTEEEYKKQIDFVKKDINEWIDKNYEIFKHNQDNFYKMINSDNLPHQLFIEKIIKNI